MNKLLSKYLFIYPVHIVRGELNAVNNSSRKISEFTCNEISEYQLCKFKYILDEVLTKYPYYKEIFRHIRYTPNSNIKNLLKEIPFLTKDIIRRKLPNPGAFSWLRLGHRSTSGSCGTPLVFYKDRVATGFMDSVQNSAYLWHNIDLGEPQGRFWGMPKGWNGKLARFKDVLKNRVRFSAFDLSAKAMFTYYQRLMQFRPTYFYGYPSLILEFARFLKQEGLSLDVLRLKAVIGTGEYLYPEEKQELEELLGVRFVSEYGCSEVGVIGFDCPHGNMHVMSSNVLVEIVNPEGQPLPDGEEGEVVVTELNARFFPFIRYRLGDRGMLTGEACSCGRRFPLLKVSAGRKDDYIVTPDGKKVYDAILAYTLKKGVIQFKAVQSRLDYLRIDVVTDNDFTEPLEKKYVAQLHASLSPRMNIEFVKVSQIERERSGKLRYFRSEIEGIVS